MLVFLDESGDAGMKLGRGSSPYFIVGAVSFESQDEASACDAAVDDLKRKLSLGTVFEFHYVDNTRRQQRAFLETVSRFDFRTHILAIDKTRLSRQAVSFNENLYRVAAGLTFESAREHLHDATVVIDGSGDRTFRRQFQSYLKASINLDNQKHVGSVKIQPAHQNNLLQLADYVASITGGYLNNRTAGVSYRREFLQHREETFRVWP